MDDLKPFDKFHEEITKQASSLAKQGKAKWQIKSTLQGRHPEMMEKVAEIVDMIYHKEITEGGTVHHQSLKLLPIWTRNLSFGLLVFSMLCSTAMYYSGSVKNLQQDSRPILPQSKKNLPERSNISDVTLTDPIKNKPIKKKESGSSKSMQEQKENSILDDILKEVQ